MAIKNTIVWAFFSKTCIIAGKVLVKWHLIRVFIISISYKSENISNEKWARIITLSNCLEKLYIILEIRWSWLYHYNEKSKPFSLRTYKTSQYVSSDYEVILSIGYWT